MMDLREEETNLFFGRLFKRVGSGHQLNQHYLDNFFEMEGIDTNDLSRGRVRDGNALMDAEPDMNVFREWDTVQAVGPPTGAPPARSIQGAIQIKDLSRLWAYRNGQSPGA